MSPSQTQLSISCLNGGTIFLLEVSSHQNINTLNIQNPISCLSDKKSLFITVLLDTNISDISNREAHNV